MSKLLVAPLLAFARKLRFPTLFALTVIALLADLLLPDPLPMIDEIALGLLTLLFASWRQRKPREAADADR